MRRHQSQRKTKRRKPPNRLLLNKPSKLRLVKEKEKPPKNPSMERRRLPRNPGNPRRSENEDLSPQ